VTPSAKARVQLLAGILSTGVALLSAVSLRDRIRLVDILTLFFGGFAAGVSLLSAVRNWRERRLP
jgi:hypothetical protein